MRTGWDGTCKHRSITGHRAFYLHISTSSCASLSPWLLPSTHEAIVHDPAQALQSLHVLSEVKLYQA